jgi:type IV pilus assembly protein PilV
MSMMHVRHAGSRQRSGPRSATRARYQGFALIEILVSLLVAAFGVVALAGIQTRAAALELEANQRAQALVLLRDLAERITANKPLASAYVGNDRGVTAAAQECSVLPSLAERDLCEWSERLRGAAVVSGARNVGAMIGARGCVVAVTSTQYQITIAWQAEMPSATPPSSCGRGAYGTETLRRSVSTVVQIADLEAS